MGIGKNVVTLIEINLGHAIAGGKRISMRIVELARRWRADRRLLESRKAIGTTGSMMVSQAFLTSTSMIALREMRLVVDFEPSVATSLGGCMISKRA